MRKYSIGGVMQYSHKEYNMQADTPEEAKQKFLEAFCKELAFMSQPYKCPRDGAWMEAPFMDSGDIEIEFTVEVNDDA